VAALAGSLLLAPLSRPAAQADVARLIVLHVPAAQLAQLNAALDLDLAAVRPDGGFEIVAHDAQLAALAARGVPYELAIPDLQAHYAARLSPLAPAQQGLAASVTPPFGAGSMGGYWTYAEVVSVMDQLAAAYPAIVAPKIAIGTTIEGRTLWAFKISDNPLVDEAEPEVRLDALHHAREPESMQALMWYVLWLVGNDGSDPLATYLVNERETWFVPVVNPDGYVYNQTTNPGGGGLWRKNRRNNGDGSFGVDLNRNYPSFWGWDDVGSSGSKSSDTYRGTAAASEPETAAMVAFIAAHPFRTAISLHTYSDVWLSPYGYAELYPENKPQYDEIAGLATEVNGYPAGPASVLLYLANGVTADHDHVTHGTLSWSPELGSDSDGFWPPSSRIVPLAQENLLGLQRTVLAAGAWVHAASVAVTDAGHDGVFDPGEEVDLVLTLRNSGTAATGTSVTATLTTSAPGVSVLDGTHDFGTLASFSSADNAAAPLRLALGAGLSGGTIVPWSVALSYEGWTQTLTGSIQIGKRRPFLLDDVETDFGWTAGVAGDNATTGKWVRGAPIGTTNNGTPLAPGADATPAPGTQAFVTGNGGGSAGTDDVDNGHTTLLSPLFDLSGTGPAVLSYARWYSDQTVADDTLAVSLSNDGGASWVPLESVSGNQNSWKRPEFQVTAFLPQTDRMRLRFITGDEPNNSLLEAGVDDLELDIYDAGPRINLYGPQTQGSNLALNLSGQVDDNYLWFISPSTGFTQIGSIDGPLLLAPGTLIPLFGGSVPGSGLSAVIASVPVNPALSGVSVYFQAFVLRAGHKFLTNLETLALP
jgi:hypothetical protein